MTRFFTSAPATSRLLWGSFLTLGLASCGSDDDPEAVTIPANSVLVLNEGNFQKANAEVSVLSKTASSVLYSSAFSAANKRSLGDVAQSMSLRGSTAYIVVNNSNKLEVASMPNFKSVATIEGLKLPRYFAAVSDTKGYVTETVSYSATAGQVSVLDLRTNAVVKTIAVGKQPERLLAVGNRLYVTNSGGSTVTIINTDTDEALGNVLVGDAPNSLVQGSDGNIWVLSGGRVAYNADFSVDYTRTTKGSLSKIVPGQAGVTTLEMPTNTSSPGRLTTNGAKNELYYTYQGGVYMHTIGNAALPTQPLIRRNLYALAVDPTDRTIYGGVASFTSTDKVIRYRPTGAPIDSFTVNIGPNGFVFN